MPELASGVVDPVVEAKTAKVKQGSNEEKVKGKDGKKKKEEYVMSAETLQLIDELREAGLKKKTDLEILGTLGKGKFACVYKARIGDKLFAVKKIQIFEMMSVKSREKCLKEIKLLQTVSHENIIKYVDSWIDPSNNELVIILEWAQGGDLKKLIKKVKKANRGFSERQVWKYCVEIAAGLSHMHDKRVMHRDLKPANIMLTRDNHIKLGDLGLSRYFTSQTLEVFSKVGTPLYMSPEVLVGNGYGFPADGKKRIYERIRAFEKNSYQFSSVFQLLLVWSLGCVLYELCVLRSPFKPEKGVNLYALFKKIKTGEFEPIPEDSLYSASLRNLINQMITLDFSARPTMKEIVQMGKKMFSKLESEGSGQRKDAETEQPPSGRSEKESSRDNSKGGERQGRKSEEDTPSTRQNRDNAENPKSSKYTRADGGAGSARGRTSLSREKSARDSGRRGKGTGGTVPTPEIVMQQVIDTLQVLNYEELFCSKFHTPVLARTQFALYHGRNNREQFLYFSRLASWLMTLNGKQGMEHHLLELDLDSDNTNQDNADNRIQIASTICNAMRELQLAVDFVPTALRKGHGIEVCQCLLRLALAALQNTGFSFQKPKYPSPPAPDVETTLDNLGDEESEESKDNGDRVIGESMAVFEASFAPDIPTVDYAKLGVGFGFRGVVEEDTTRIDGMEGDDAASAKWAAELQRLADSGRFKTKKQLAGGSGWEGRVRQVGAFVKAMEEAKDPAKLSVLKISKQLQGTLEKVSTLERRINRDHMDLAMDYQRAHKKHVEQMDQYETMAAEVSEQTERLQAAEVEASEIQSQLLERRSGLTDEGKIVDIRKALEQLKGDIAQLDVTIGVKTQRMWKLGVGAEAERQKRRSKPSTQS